MADRRVTGEGSIYQRKSDGRWVGVVDLGWVGGKRVRKTVTAPTLKELRPKFKRLKLELESGVVPEHMTVEQWMNRWFAKTATGRNKTSTLETYRRYIDKWIIPYLGKYRLDRLRGEHIEALYDAMEEAGREDATRRQVHAILHRALKVAVRQRKIATNPADHVEPPPVGNGSHGKFTLVEAKTILRSIGDDPMRSRWACALLAGIRQGEALGLTWDKIDFENNCIIVDQAIQQVKGQGLQIVGLKSKSAYRAVPMVEPVRVLLLAEQQSSGFVWGGEKPIGPRADWQAWTDMLATVGIEHRPLHAARATTGSLLADAGVSPKMIAEILGHAQTATTERHYIHGDNSMHQGAMGKMAALLLED